MNYTASSLYMCDVVNLKNFVIYNKETENLEVAVKNSARK